MRKFLLVVCLLSMATSLFAQNQIPGNTTPFIKKRGLFIGLSYQDFRTTRLVEETSLATVINRRQISNLKDMDPGIVVSYFETLSGHLDFISSLSFNPVRYPYKDRAMPQAAKFLIEGDVNANLRLLRDEYLFNPYLTAGAGVSYYDVHFGGYIPLGAGISVRLGESDRLRLQLQYRIGITELTRDHLNLSLSFGSLWGSAPKPAPPAPPVVTDRDSDGIPDDRDQCPDVPGVVQYNGCPVPDSDNDGINDLDDKCPTVPGLAKYDGCPIPDSDGDKINDEEDKCPNEAGVARLQGCPEKDTDGDGVPDDLDRCPNEAGPASNNGCPERKAPTQEEVKKVEEAARFIYFETGSAKLKSTSTPALQQVVAIMKDNSDAVITIEGHTDNVGSASLNKKLSEDRAASVKKYLVDKGIDESRITSAGYGFDKPVAPNNTAAGRAKNRRVVMILE